MPRHRNRRERGVSGARVQHAWGDLTFAVQSRCLRSILSFTLADMGAERDVPSAPMHSPVNWALLGLVIERPSYAYELAQRFERTYGEALSLSSVSHVYTALAALRARSLIEELPGTRTGRQPKPRYRATEHGLLDYGDWLVSQVGEDRRRQRLFVLQIATLTRDPPAALEILTRYEQACLTEAQASSLPSRGESVPDGPGELAARLAAEESRLALGAKLSWVVYARAELATLAQARAPRR
jgi:DNA-binding PadR family transcriptional regulator